MEDIIGNLKNNTIISRENIVILKDYISKKYPNNTNKQNSLVFADCVNKILDKNMQQFDERYRVELKRSILKNAVNKKNFTVNAADILSECMHLRDPNNEFRDNMLNWVNVNQKSKITHDGLTGIINKLDNENKTLKPEKKLSDSKENIEEVLPRDKGYDEVIEYNTTYEKQGSSKKYKSALLLSFTFICIFVMLQGSLFLSGKVNTNKQENVHNNNNNLQKSTYENNLEKHLKYVDIDSEKLRNWLKDKNSLIADEPYLGSILEVGRKYNINPLLLIAITGQEQGFVPKNNKYAKKIVNNPYNVYYSWKKYNTNIKDSTEIAAKTLINLSKDKPENANSIKWINKRYAEDKNWWMGVSKIFNKLDSEICN